MKMGIITRRETHMRLVTFVAPDGQARAGALLGEVVVDLAVAAPLAIEEADGLRWDMASLLRGDQENVNLETAADILAAAGHMAAGLNDLFPQAEPADMTLDLSGSLSIGAAPMLLPQRQIRLLAPLPHPNSVRMFLASEHHARARFAAIGHDLPVQWQRFPAFSFINHNAIYGSDAVVAFPQSDARDFGLCLGCVIGRSGRDLEPWDAVQYIAGYMIVNAWADRDIEREELQLGLGMGKASDFALSLGPYLVTPDELEIYADDDWRLSLNAVATINAEEETRCNTALMKYSFGDMITHASRDVSLYPGDLLCSGPLDRGSLLETRGEYGPWLDPGDQVSLEITGLGRLTNTIE
jgi:fumarylacetoacetate (FAA) hydrolase